MPNFGYQQQDSFTTPNDNTLVYHSIHLDYLKESIKKKQLRFASVSSYRDSFEGKCTATGNSGHSLRQDCGIISIYLKGVSDGETKTKKLHSRV